MQRIGTVVRYKTSRLNACFSRRCYLYLHEVKSCLIEADWKRTISMAPAHPSLAYICDPQFVNEWLALWDCAVDYGTLGTKFSKTVFKIMCKPVFGDNIICCYCSNTIDEPSFLNHLTVARALDQHTVFLPFYKQDCTVLTSSQ